MPDKLIQGIISLKEEKDALILAHNYQLNEVQDIADFVGDSFALSQQAAAARQNVIVFCGVYFMAEVAKVLAPDKTVLLPDISAGCPLADTVSLEELRAFKKRYPGAAVVSYVNSPVEVKAESDICCTSSNAVRVVDSLKEEEIIFVPDKNLAHWVAGQTRKRIIPWNGCCPTHQAVSVEDVHRIREEHPGVPVAVHPECPPEVVAAADFVGSTGSILKFVRTNHDREMIIGTEKGILHRLEIENPGKQFYLLSPGLICPTMKLASLEKVLAALENMTGAVTVPQDLVQRARKALERMLAVE